MLTFAAIAPHTLDLLKEPKKATATRDALALLQKSFSDAALDTVLIISPHSTTLAKAFSVNLAQEYVLDLMELGVKTPKRTVKSDPFTTMSIKKVRETDSDAPVILASAAHVDYATAVPLYFVLPKDSATAIIPIGCAHQPLPVHYAFGETLKDVIMASTKRFGVIASATLTHGKDGKNFDDRIVAALQSDEKAKDLLTVTDDESKKFDTCALRPLAILAGILHGLPWTYTPHAYTYTFDTGLLVASFALNE